MLFVVGWCVRSNLKGAREYGDAAPKPSYYGIYDVTGDARYRVAFLERQWGGLRTIGGLGLAFQLPPKNGIVEAHTVGPAPKSGTLTFSPPDAEHITLQGTIGDEKVQLDLKRSAGYKVLGSRGFHLVTPFPFNR